MTVPDPADVVPPPPSEPASPEPSSPDPSEQLELKLPDESSAWKDLALWAGVLVLLALVAYWPALGGRFQWLDDRAVSDDVLLAKPGGMSYVWLGRWAQPGHYRFAAYQPVAFTADWLAYRMGGHGGENDPRPTPTAYHVVSLACHAAAAVLAWLALRELAVSGAWLVAAVFALHPANAEAVSWISDGGVPVGGMLFFGSIYAYLGYMTFRARDAADRAAGGPGGDPAQTWGLYATAVVLAILAALAWPAAGAAPAVLLLALWWRRRLTRFDAALIAPVLVVTAALWLANFGLPRPTYPDGVAAAADVGPLHAIALIGESLAFAIGKLLVPVRLSLLYSDTLAGGLASLVVLGGAVAAAFAVALRGGPRGPAAAAGAFVVCVVPALNWFDPARHSRQVDPLAYLAAVPLAALVLGAVSAGVRRVRPAGVGHVQAVVIASAVVLVLLGGGAWERAHAFDTPVSLWQDTVNKRPASTLARGQLAEQLRLRSAEDAAVGDDDRSNADLAAAIDTARQAVELAGGNAVAAAPAQRTWGAALAATGDLKKYAEALPHYDLATRPDAGPPEARTLVDYGRLLLALDRTLEAIAKLDLALGADPTYGPAHRVLGQAYAKLKDDRRELTEEELAVQADPMDLQARELLADALAKAGRLDEALAQYSIPLRDRVEQTHGELWQAVAKVCDRQQKYVESVQFFKQAKQLNPKLPGIDAELDDAKRKLAKAAATRPAMTQPTTAPAAGGGDLMPS
jgi:tetratricopeptide (TPR) repeat protein